MSVEWQFYLLYPVFLLILNKLFKTKKIHLLIFIDLTILVLVISLLASEIEPTASFYFFPTRSWEMLVGGLAFFAEGLVKDYKYRRHLAVIGYLSLLACMILLKPTMVWAGVFTLLPVCGTFLIIISNYNDLKSIKFNSVQFIGKISYSLYFWHWPVYVIFQYLGYEVNYQTVILFLILSIALGYLSYKYIEAIQSAAIN